MIYDCPLDDCRFQTQDVEPAVAAVMLTIHAAIHAQPRKQQARVENVKRPEVTSSGTTEYWIYFQTRWADYVRTTKVRGTDLVMQLLECCDSQDLTRNAG